MRWHWLQTLSQLRYAAQGQQEERCWKVSQERQTPREQTRSQAKKKSEGRVCDKLNNLVLFDKATYDQLCREHLNYWVG